MKEVYESRKQNKTHTPHASGSMLLLEEGATTLERRTFETGTRKPHTRNSLVEKKEISSLSEVRMLKVIVHSYIIDW